MTHLSFTDVQKWRAEVSSHVFWFERWTVCITSIVTNHHKDTLIFQQFHHVITHSHTQKGILFTVPYEQSIKIILFTIVSQKDEIRHVTLWISPWTQTQEWLNSRFKTSSVKNVNILTAHATRGLTCLRVKREEFKCSQILLSRPRGSELRTS